MPKRAVSQANVDKSACKLDQGLTALEAKDDKLKFQADLKELTKDLKAHPEKIKRMKLVVKMETSRR